MLQKSTKYSVVSKIIRGLYSSQCTVVVLRTPLVGRVELLVVLVGLLVVLVELLVVLADLVGAKEESTNSIS